jgi:hypothetical protein
LRHEILPELRKAVPTSAYSPSVVAFGRMHPKEWRGVDHTSFKPVELTPFLKEHIEDLLSREAKKLGFTNFSHEAYSAWADIILKLSHGHPRCIANLVSLLCVERFAIPPHELDSPAIFQDFIVEVIKREILSDENLAPLASARKKNAITVRLQEILPYICVFRFYLPAQLLILAYCKLIKKDEISELEDWLSDTFILDQSQDAQDEAWYRPHKVIRGLLADTLHRHDPDAFAQINQSACSFYDAWIKGKAKKQIPYLLKGGLNDQNQIYYIIEGLYHHAQTGKSHDNMIKLLKSYLAALRSVVCPFKNLTRMLADNIEKNEELQQILHRQEDPENYQKLIKVIENWQN